MDNFDIPLAPGGYSRDDFAKLQIFEKILKGNVEGIIITDTGGNIEWVNNAFSALTGYAKGDALGRNLGFLFVGAQNVYEALCQKLNEVNHQEAETWIGHKEGSKFLAKATLSAVRSDADMITHHVVEFSDITEFRYAQDKLAQRTKELSRSNQELEQFAYVASHDLQEPLRMVSSYLQLLHQRYAGRLGVDADEFIVFAVDGAKRMQALINDLLAYSRVGTRGAPFQRVDCARVLDRVLADLQVAVQEGQANIYRDPLPAVWGDEVQLGQLFQNLIGNAIKFRSQRCPEVRVGVNRQNGHWLFRVEDNGVGIEPEYWERIFLIFQRLHTREEYSGTGVGLAICKRIVERHGGRIWLESKPGEGSTFYFTLPALVEAAP